VSFNDNLSFLLSPARRRGWVRGLRTSIPPHLTSPPGGGEELEVKAELY